MRTKAIPRTDSIQELAQFWDSHDLTDFAEDLEEVSERMSKEHYSNDPLIGFGISEQVASFLLFDAFKYAHEAAAYEVASELFAERIESIDPVAGWQLPSLPKGLMDWLTQRTEIDDKLLDPATTERLAEAKHPNEIHILARER
jgi:hypothetical protein